MRQKYEGFAFLLVLSVLGLTSQAVRIGHASESQNVEFEVLDHGDLSGYIEETYLVISTESEWARVWEKHISPYMPKKPYPEIIFSKTMVICAFMGKRLTTGYSISLDRIWAEDERMQVVIVKHSPPKHAIVGEVLTYPYIFVSINRTDLEIIFKITEERGKIYEFNPAELTLNASESPANESGGNYGAITGEAPPTPEESSEEAYGVTGNTDSLGAGGSDFWSTKVADSTPFGGVWIEINKPSLLTSHIGLTLTVVVIAILAVYWGKRSSRKAVIQRR